jgi:hypothetical protein
VVVVVSLLWRDNLSSVLKTATPLGYHHLQNAPHDQSLYLLLSSRIDMKGVFSADASVYHPSGLQVFVCVFLLLFVCCFLYVCGRGRGEMLIGLRLVPTVLIQDISISNF